MIVWSFVSRDINLLIRAFITYVRPLVEYNTVFWSPSALRDIDALESIQRRFTKRLSGLKHMPYAKRLKYLNLPSLELRRIRADMYWCYKTVYGLVASSLTTFPFERCYCYSWS